jgi:polyisoprenoid-binding protein YceI
MGTATVEPGIVGAHGAGVPGRRAQRPRGSTTVNRKDWGVTWNTALETGGVLVGEKVTLEFETSATKDA